MMDQNSYIDINETDESDDEESDLIALNGCDKFTQWQFPHDLSKCPEPSCGSQFEDRSTAMTHYKEHHAAHAILCYICDKPIRAKTPDEYRRHFDAIHPKIEVPFVFGPTENPPGERMNEDEEV